VLAIASPGSGEPTGVSQFVAQFLRLRRYCTFLANAERLFLLKSDYLVSVILTLSSNRLSDYSTPMARSDELTRLTFIMATFWFADG